jgi:hypothetical protein
MGINRNIFKWIFQNITPGEVNPEKRVDADRIMDNFYTLSDSISIASARGEFAKDGNSNGVSTQNQCNLSLLTDKGVDGLLNVGDFVEVSDGINIWQKRTFDQPSTNKDDELSFSDLNLIKGGGPDDYSNPDFISSLLITIRKGNTPDIVQAERIQLKGKGCLSGEKILRSEESETSLDEALSGVITNFYLQHNEDGTHKEAVLLSENLDADCFSDEGFANIIDGSFEYDPDGDGCAYPWSRYNEPDLSIVTSPVYEGSYSQKIVATQDGDGIELTIIDIKHLWGKKITVSARAYCESAQVVIEVYDGTNTYQSEPFGTMGEWDKGILTCAISQNAINVKVRIYLVSAGTSYIDAVQITTGSHDIAFTPSPEVYVRDKISEVSPLNFIMGFERWTGYQDALFNLPDGWMPANSQPDVLRRYSNLSAIGIYSCEIQARNNQGIIQNIPVEFINQLKDNPLGFSIHMSKLDDSGDDPVKIGIYSGEIPIATTQILTSVIPVGSFRQFSIFGEVPHNAEEISVRIENMAGTQENFHILADGVMLTLARYPARFFPCNIYESIIFGFSMAGTIDNGYLAGPSGIVGEGWVLPYNVRASRLSLNLTTPPQPQGTVSVALRVNGENTDLVIVLNNQKSRGASFKFVDIDPTDDTLGLYATASIGNGAQDLYAILELLKMNM